jgi:hypothetical protein
VKNRKDRKKEEGTKKKGDGIQTAELDRRDQVTATKSWPNFPSGRVATEAAWLDGNNLENEEIKKKKEKIKERLDTHRPSHGRT